ncbi:hypothetical protein [Rubripirellula reticaptiva]|uniref:Uncharacterized protein n=1 Tax=Rubripirellula reticaptiva TaxID=2528013 RepID=A0A5C6F4J5_9BACT|nr:hypothetical protein [Rubripirellula reticaptiva]TWU56268.1 hypothetical protein Poly59_25720 [Rubripirellula reticaptiva]
MRFTEDEIVAAKRLHECGLPWEPQAGHYVFDETGFCEQSSPFQEKVYFILNYSYFMRIVGGVKRFTEIMVWLPTWEDLREVLRDLGLSDIEVANYLDERQATGLGSERLALYQLVQDCLSKSATSPQEVQSSDQTES